MSKVVFGLADNSEHAERIVQKLEKAGFAYSEISVLYSDNRKTAIRKEVGREGFLDEEVVVEEHRTLGKKGTLGTEKHTKAPEGGVTGATAGGLIGGSLGLLAGIGSLAIPGLGPFIAAGPIIAALSGSAIGGALGLLVGSLVGLGIPEYEAKKYESQLRKGFVLISVNANDSKRIDRAKEIFQQENAHDIATSSEKAGSR